MFSHKNIDVIMFVAMLCVSLQKAGAVKATSYRYKYVAKHPKQVLNCVEYKCYYY